MQGPKQAEAGALNHATVLWCCSWRGQCPVGFGRGSSLPGQHAACLWASARVCCTNNQAAIAVAGMSRGRLRTSNCLVRTSSSGIKREVVDLFVLKTHSWHWLPSPNLRQVNPTQTLSRIYLVNQHDYSLLHVQSALCLISFTYSTDLGPLFSRVQIFQTCDCYRI